MPSALKPTEQRQFDKKIYGFDIETYDLNREFLCGSVVDDEDEHIAFSKPSMISQFRESYFTDCIICATNLQFDFFGTFHGEPDLKQFRPLFQGSEMLCTESYKYNGRFVGMRKDITTHKAKKLSFIDTLNYAKMGVEKAGKILGLPKLDKPDRLGEHVPNTGEEWDVMLEYNIRDSVISGGLIEFLYSVFEELGATPKITIAATAMSLFKNHYLTRTIYRHPIHVLIDQFKGYYGGMTESFCRGRIQGYNYYDVNSLYPYVMQKFRYPDPNTLRTNTKNTVKYINEYEGMSHIEIHCPATVRYPVLPYRYLDKCVFGTGTFTGWYTHVEIRKAMSMGYVVKKVMKTYYYLKTCDPFSGYVSDLYNKRLKYKSEKNPMEYVVKILLNSLYGKFGSKFIDKENWVPEEQFDMSKLNNIDFIEIVEGFVRMKKSLSEPSAFCIPIWAAHVTAYARMHLNELCHQANPVYCDTDSILTKNELPTGKELGELKLEMRIEDGFIVKPKFYALEYSDNDTLKECVKIKGVSRKLSMLEFKGLLWEQDDRERKVAYQKFLKFKESLRRKLTPNLIVDIVKVLSVEDTKRIWTDPFRSDILQESRPMHFTEGIGEREIERASWDTGHQTQDNQSRNIYIPL